MKISEIMEDSTLTAIPHKHLDPITRKPLVSYRIYKDGAEIGMVTGHQASTPEEAVQKYLDREQWKTAQTPAPVARKAGRIREPRPDVRVWIVPPRIRQTITSSDEPDEYLYHVTTWPRARQIIRQGLRVNQSPTFSNYSFHSGSRVFLTERAGVTFWEERVEQHLQHDYDTPPPIAVLRVRRADVAEMLRPDPVGTKDAHEPSYYIEADFA